MLGHKSVATTQKYLGVSYASVRDVLEKIAVSGDLTEIENVSSTLQSMPVFLPLMVFIDYPLLP